MALQGEGDPRWVVREREDGKNVGKWHWEERNVTTWAHDRIKALLNVPALSLEPIDGVNITIEDVYKVDGDAMLYNRKGVLKVLYDLKVNGKWATAHEDEKARTTGTYNFELFDEDPEVVVAFDAKTKCDARYKQAVFKALSPVVATSAATFLRELRAGAGQALDGVATEKPKPLLPESRVTDFLRSGMDTAPAAKPKPEKNPGTTTLDLADRYNCAEVDLFRALTERKQLEAITRAACESNPVSGGAFSLMRGVVTGVYQKLDMPNTIQCTWRMKTWDEGVEGKCTMNIARSDDVTALNVRIIGVPVKYKTETEGFWRVQILQAIKVMLGYGTGGGGAFF